MNEDQDEFYNQDGQEVIQVFIQYFLYRLASQSKLSVIVQENHYQFSKELEGLLLQQPDYDDNLEFFDSFCELIQNEYSFKSQMISGLFKKIFINLYDQMSEDQKYQIIKIIDNFMFKFSLSQ